MILTINYHDILKAPVSLCPGLQQLLTAPAQSPPAEGAGHSPASESPTIEKVDNQIHVSNMRHSETAREGPPEPAAELPKAPSAAP